MKDAPSSHALGLGRGALNWPAIERKSGRYGLVALYPEAETGAEDAPLPLAQADRAGVAGRLFVRVATGRPSYHAGDAFRGIFPPKNPPESGEERTLGHGTLFFERASEGGTPKLVGVRPADGRPDDWLDPRALYDVHNSVVELFFLPDHP
jgi:hypothetical protein